MNAMSLYPLPQFPSSLPNPAVNFSLRPSFNAYIKNAAEQENKTIRDTPVHFIKELIKQQATGKVIIRNPLDELGATSN